MGAKSSQQDNEKESEASYLLTDDGNLSGPYLYQSLLTDAPCFAVAETGIKAFINVFRHFMISPVKAKLDVISKSTGDLLRSLTRSRKPARKVQGIWLRLKMCISGGHKLS